MGNVPSPRNTEPRAKTNVGFDWNLGFRVTGSVMGGSGETLLSTVDALRLAFAGWRESGRGGQVASICCLGF